MIKLTPAQDRLLREAAAPKPANNWSIRGNGRVHPYSSDSRPCETLERLGLIERRLAHSAQDISAMQAQQDVYFKSAMECMQRGAWLDALQDLNKADSIRRKLEQRDYFVTQAGYEYLKGVSA